MIRRDAVMQGHLHGADVAMCFALCPSEISLCWEPCCLFAEESVWVVAVRARRMAGHSGVSDVSLAYRRMSWHGGVVGYARSELWRLLLGLRL